MATRLAERIKEACDPLCRFPLAGPARETFAPGPRIGFAGNYAIYYLHDAQGLVVVRVLHGRRDAAALADEDGFASR